MMDGLAAAAAGADDAGPAGRSRLVPGRFLGQARRLVGIAEVVARAEAAGAILVLAWRGCVRALAVARRVTLGIGSVVGHTAPRASEADQARQGMCGEW